MKPLTILLIFISVSPLCWGREKHIVRSTRTDIYIKVGDKMLDYQFEHVEHFSKNKVSIGTFKGIWLIIDCWNRYCSVCIKSFPKTNALQKQFSGKIQFFLVGNTKYNGRNETDVDNPGLSQEERIKILYEKYRIKEHLQLPIAYDSVFCKRNDIEAGPYMIIIDPAGVIRGITTSLTAVDIEDFLHGKQPSIPKAWRAHEDGIGSPYTHARIVIEKMNEKIKRNDSIKNANSKN